MKLKNKESKRNNGYYKVIEWMYDIPELNTTRKLAMFAIAYTFEQGSLKQRFCNMDYLIKLGGFKQSSAYDCVNKLDKQNIIHKSTIDNKIVDLRVNNELVSRVIKNKPFQGSRQYWYVVENWMNKIPILENSELKKQIFAIIYTFNQNTGQPFYNFELLKFFTRVPRESILRALKELTNAKLILKEKLKFNLFPEYIVNWNELVDVYAIDAWSHKYAIF